MITNNFRYLFPSKSFIINVEKSQLPLYKDVTVPAAVWNGIHKAPVSLVFSLSVIQMTKKKVLFTIKKTIKLCHSKCHSYNPPNEEHMR